MLKVKTPAGTFIGSLVSFGDTKIKLRLNDSLDQDAGIVLNIQRSRIIECETIDNLEVGVKTVEYIEDYLNPWVSAVRDNDEIPF